MGEWRAVSWRSTSEIQADVCVAAVACGKRGTRPDAAEPSNLRASPHHRPALLRYRKPVSSGELDGDGHTCAPSASLGQALHQPNCPANATRMRIDAVITRRSRGLKLRMHLNNTNRRPRSALTSRMAACYPRSIRKEVMWMDSYPSCEALSLVRLHRDSLEVVAG